MVLITEYKHYLKKTNTDTISRGDIESEERDWIKIIRTDGILTNPSMKNPKSKKEAGSYDKRCYRLLSKSIAILVHLPY